MVVTRGRAMHDIRVTANLPQLDVEIVREKFPEDGNEVMTIRMRATPSFRQVADTMVPRLLGAALPALPAPTFAAASMTMWTLPLMLWSQMARAAWSPMVSMIGAMQAVADVDPRSRT